MFGGSIRGKHRAQALASVGLLGFACSVACSGQHHDCYEMRSCPGSSSSEGGSGQGQENAGSAGQAGDGPSSAGSPKNTSSSAGDAGAPAVAESPRVLSVSPNDGALGVARDARIVIRFSRAMDEAATELAYQSLDLPASTLGFSWNSTATELTLTPRVPLEYALAPAGDGERVATAARMYHYGFDASAVDELGQALPPVHLAFSTLRHGSLELTAERERTGNWTLGEDEGIHNCLRKPQAGYEPTVCVGDDINNVRYSGFLSFDLGALPDDVAQISSAHLLANALVHGVPGELGASRLEHVRYGELDESALGSAPVSDQSPLFLAKNLDQAQLSLDLDVSAALRNDYENRAARGGRSQYRLSFAKVTANGRWDDVELPTRGIRLQLGYLVP